MVEAINYIKNNTVHSVLTHNPHTHAPASPAVAPKRHRTWEISKKQLYLALATTLAVGFVILLIVIFLGVYAKYIGLWVASVAFFFIMRYPDTWKMGLEAFYLFTFIYSYVFDLIFVLPVIYLSFGLVVYVRPDEGNGVFVHVIALTGLAITARLFFNMHGTAITSGQFLFAVLFSIAIWLVVDGIIALKTAPVPWQKLMIIHALQVIVTYYIVTFVGYKILKFFLAFGKIG